jgi:hypothetical protein
MSMADGFSASMTGIPQLKAALDAKQARMEKGALWALRQTGRIAATAAKLDAPVYKGSGALTQKAFRADRKGAGINTPIKGLLRAQIKPSRRITSAAGVMYMSVGPRGPRVRLYASKVEAQKPYMEAGRAAAEAAAVATWAAAMTRALNT